jgi:POT family proton-dependent oligopeptide transporter
MWERFNFYGMRALLSLFLVNALAFKQNEASILYGGFLGLSYLTTMMGGFISDRFLGNRNCIILGGLVMAIGQLCLFGSANTFQGNIDLANGLMWLGLLFLIFGNGFFKPNISSMVGQLYKNDDPRRDAGFSFFYMGVNLGALIGGYICIAVAEGSMWQSLVPENLRWNVGFGFAAVVMIISLLTFTQTQKSLGPIGLSPLETIEKSKRKLAELSTFIGSLLIIPLIILMVENTEYTKWFMIFIGPISILYLIYEMRSFSSSENKKLVAALVFMLFSIVFWAFFEQSGGSLSLFAANNLNNTIAGIELSPNGINNSANSFFVIGFAALVGLVWMWMGKRKIEPNTVIKFGIAFLFLAGGFWVFYYTKFLAGADGKTSLGLFTFGWFIITFGELCLSPIGMSAMSKLSPKETQAVIMGMWFLASSYGQYFAGILGANIAEASEKSSNAAKLIVYADGYKQLGLYALIAGIVLIAISPFIKKLMQEVK